MSGGSMDYLCYKVEEVSFTQDTVDRMAFAAHLKLIGKALHDIEWVDSGDMSPGDENNAIRACLSPQLLLSSALINAERAHDLLTQEIAKAKNLKGK